MIKQFIKLSAVAAFAFAFVVAPVASATASTVYVTPSNMQGWSDTAPLVDTRVGGDAEILSDVDTSYGDGALKLTTTNTGPAMVQMMKGAGVQLDSIQTLKYSTKQVSASFVAGLPSFQLPVCLYGLNEAGTNCDVVPETATSSFTTLVYEPYVDQGNAAVQNNVWQRWDVVAGKLWSSRTVATLQSSQGTYTYELADLNQEFPDAVLLSYGVNLGTNNPDYNTRVDGVEVNDTLYDFELIAPKPVPSVKDDCKNDGWKTLVNANGDSFKNQGQCVSYVTASENSKAKRGDTLAPSVRF